jgi:hypothetical protein
MLASLSAFSEIAKPDLVLPLASAMKPSSARQFATWRTPAGSVPNRSRTISTITYVIAATGLPVTG